MAPTGDRVQHSRLGTRGTGTPQVCFIISLWHFHLLITAHNYKDKLQILIQAKKLNTKCQIALYKVINYNLRLNVA